MMILVSKAPVSLEAQRRPNLGLLLSPRSWWAPPDGWIWAADNDAFSGFDEDAYVRMLDTHSDKGAAWVTLPDVVGDSESTLSLFDEWAERVSNLGWPLAFVAQDGVDVRDVPWADIECLFVGGTTEWKMGGEAREAVGAAKAFGKWVHMGRVNSMRRIRYAKAIGCDSVDGTQYSMFTDTWLDRDLVFAASDGQMMLEVTE